MSDARKLLQRLCRALPTCLSDGEAHLILRECRAYLAQSDAPAPPTVAEAHRRIVNGQGTHADLVRVLGDPHVGVTFPTAPAPLPADAIVGSFTEAQPLIDFLHAAPARDALVRALEDEAQRHIGRHAGVQQYRTVQELMLAAAAALAEPDAPRAEPVAQSAIDYQRRRGAFADIVDEAIAAYRSWYMDDDYDAKGALDGIVKRMIERRAIYSAAPPERSAAQRDDDARAKYDELLYAVATKHPGETRHETALRYIREREAPDDNAIGAQEGR